jgi:hypothetical protein
MMFTKYKLCRTGALSVATILFGIASLAPYVRAESAQPKYSADVPSYITTPDSVKTRIGTLKFKNGAPDPDTVKLVYDQVDFSRGIQAFLTAISGTSVYAACEGLIEAGVKLNKGTAITENLMDARSLFLTPNTTTVYVISCIDLKDGPVIAQVPPEVLGPVDDGYFRWVTDVGLTGPDKGKGGKYLLRGRYPIRQLSRGQASHESAGDVLPRLRKRWRYPGRGGAGERERQYLSVVESWRATDARVCQYFRYEIQYDQLEHVPLL